MAAESCKIVHIVEKIEPNLSGDSFHLQRRVTVPGLRGKEICEVLRYIYRHRFSVFWRCPVNSSKRSAREELIAADIKRLHALGYAQELFRAMGGFSNFAISFTIITFGPQIPADGLVNG